MYVCVREVVVYEYMDTRLGFAGVRDGQRQQKTKK